MRLKSLKLAGFKSFANVTTFTFPRGITAIVGPNGCGKSNVIDAIRWVLGETSAKQLRGGAMSDVIFAGTQEKAAKSVASVELTFEHTQDEQTGIRHEFNIYQELSVRRQVNLEGRSDYFINGTRCRRRDVIDVFLGTGLGDRSYAVIEQGMIGRIVDSNPLQLREFIEEAAGVSRYQARRAETQNKLEKTQENLARLQDIQSELERQKKSLAKQATSAQRYNELNKTLADIKQQLAIQQLYQAKHTQQQHKSVHEQSKKVVTSLQADYESLKGKQDKLTDHINQEQWLKDDAQSVHYQQQLSYQQAEQQLNNSKAQLMQIEQQLVSLDSQQQQANAETVTLQQQQEEQQSALSALTPQLSELTAKRERCSQDEPPLKQALYQAQDELAQLQHRERSLEQQQALNNQSQQRYTLSQDKWLRRQQNWQQLWQQLQHSDSSIAAAAGTDTTKTLDLQIEALKNELRQIARQQHSIAERLSELQPQARVLQQQLIAQQRELVEQEKSQALLAGEYDTLYQILHQTLPQILPSKDIDKQPSATSTNSANIDLEDKLSSVQHKPAKLAMTTLREQIELSDQGQHYAQLLDSLLALWLDSDVFINSQLEITKSHESVPLASNLGQALGDYLPELLCYQQQDSGNNQSTHSLWLPANVNNNQQKSFIDELAVELKDKVLPLSQLITQPALALWQHCYLYLTDELVHSGDSNEALVTIVKALPPSALIMTTDGWIISRLGTINLARLASAQDGQNDNHFLSQRLQQRVRLEQLEKQLDEFDSNIDAQQLIIKRTQANYDILMVNIEETHAQAERLTQDSYRNQQQLASQQATNERILAADKRRQTDEQRLQADKVVLEVEQQELADEQQALTSEKQQIAQDISAIIPRLQVSRDRVQQLQAERNTLNRNRQTDDNAWQALQLTIQKAEMRLENTATSLARVHLAHQQALQSEQQLQANLAIYQAQLPDLQAKLQSAKLARDKQQGILSTRETALSALKHDYSVQQSELETQQTELQNQQGLLASLATQLALSDAKLEEACGQTKIALDEYYQINHHEQAAQTSISVSSLLTDFIIHERRVRPDKIAQLQSEQTALEQQLNKIGAVNLAAVAELAEVEERLAPLVQQTEDIAASMDMLTAAIDSIDATTKTLFLQMLEAVNTELASLFAKVFGGGHASLTLDVTSRPDGTAADKNDSEPWRAGLILMAQPKGKRNSRLAVLSGGEKTLTALSLIFAIFKQHPAPFCVLDEVDAPLDDANVARFTGLIHELAADLQFIFISHNKLAMQIADELKGITMPSAGISTLVSVSLAEAAQYIEA